MKGVAETLNVMIIIIIIGIFATILFLIRFRGTGENIVTFGEASQEFESKTLLNSLYSIHYPIVGADNEELMWVLRFGCAYGNIETGEFIVSPTIPVIFDPQLFIENYFEQKIGENYFLEIVCGNRTLDYGKKPPNNKKILSNKLMFPIPGRGYGESYLRRW